MAHKDMSPIDEEDTMLRTLFLICLIAGPWFQVHAKNEAVIIEVRKKLKLHDSERVYPDFFIVGGTKLGLDKGVTVSVVRRVPVHDPLKNASIGDFKVKVADLEIIESDSEKSIGRLIEIDRREARPMLTYDAVMIGDRLDLDTVRSGPVQKEAAQATSGDSGRQPASLADSEVVKINQPLLTKSSASMMTP